MAKFDFLQPVNATYTLLGHFLQEYVKWYEIDCKLWEAKKRLKVHQDSYKPGNAISSTTTTRSSLREAGVQLIERHKPPPNYCFK
jgi:hypothetical protein